MKIIITAKGLKDERNIRTWTNLNEFLSDIAFWFCGGNEASKEVGFFEGITNSVIYGMTNNIEFVRNGIQFLITVSEKR